MRCETCFSDNLPERRFCARCGGPLVRRCDKCSFENEPSATFCGGCGAALESDAATAGLPAAPIAGERRHLTVVFFDLVGSTPLSGRLDPEEFRDVVVAYQRSCAEAIERYGGSVGQYLGDGLLVYFGYPEAHEDDARRAVSASLDALDAIRLLNDRLAVGVEVAIRIGAHTGIVVVDAVGTGPAAQELVLGEVPNVAARLQSIAEPGTIVVSETTRKLVDRFFSAEPLGTPALKGVAHPVPAHRITGRLGAVSARPATPLVGRERELDLLAERWEQARGGQGQLVLISGEPGIGKSRLLEAFADRAGARIVEGRCSPLATNTPLYPLMDLLHALAGCRWDDDPALRTDRLESALAARSLPAGTVRLLAPYLGLDAGPDDPAGTPERRRREAFAAVERLLLGPDDSAVVIALEDLQWADATSLELLTGLAGRVSGTARLVLATARPEFRPPWPPRSHLTTLVMNRLTRDQTEAMVAGVAGGRLPAEVSVQLAARTDGIPLFVEELTKAVLESSADDTSIPATLHDSLTARLDRLREAKPVAQLAATIGRAFGYDLLHAVSDLGDDALRRALDRLIEAELVFQSGAPPQATYVFKHALIQEAAYESLLRSVRRAYHRRIAEALLDRFAAVAEAQPEVVAHHATEAGMFAEGAGLWKRAGDMAVERSANLEAIAHLRRGLAVVGHVADEPARLRAELDLQIALGPALISTEGFGAAEVERTYARARELCERLGDDQERFVVLRGLWEYYWLKPDAPAAQELARELLRLAEDTSDPSHLLVSHSVMTDTMLMLGRYEDSRAHMQQAIAFHAPEAGRRMAARYGGYDPGIGCRALGAHALWYLGDPEAALATSREAVDLSRRLAHPSTLAFALGHAAVTRWLCGERNEVEATTEESIALAQEHGLKFWEAFATILRGWARSEAGRHAEGIELIHRGIEGYRRTGGEIEMPWWSAMLASALAGVGRLDEARKVVATALAWASEKGLHLHSAELDRLAADIARRLEGT